MRSRKNKLMLLVLAFIIAGSCENEAISLSDLEIKEGSYTVLIIPDTQNYFNDDISYEVYTSIFQWTIENQGEFNIKAVLQVGDITNKNLAEEWSKAKKGYDMISKNIPFVLCLGNHDYEGSGNPKNRNTLIDEYINLDSEIFSNKVFVDNYGYFEENRLENHYVILNTQPKKTIVLSLEWFTRDPFLSWGDSILNIYRDYDAIVLTHAYLDLDNSRYDYLIHNKEKNEPYLYGPNENNKNNAQQLWEKLIKKHSNIFLVLSGHVLGTPFLKSQDDSGSVINQMAFNTQHEPNGGDGWLRLLEFWPDGKTIEVHTFSPTLNKVRRDRKNHFLFQK